MFLSFVVGLECRVVVESNYPGGGVRLTLMGLTPDGKETYAVTELSVQPEFPAEDVFWPRPGHPEGELVIAGLVDLGCIVDCGGSFRINRQIVAGFGLDAAAPCAQEPFQDQASSTEAPPSQWMVRRAGTARESRTAK